MFIALDERHFHVKQEKFRSQLRIITIKMFGEYISTKMNNVCIDCTRNIVHGQWASTEERTKMFIHSNGLSECWCALWATSH